MTFAATEKAGGEQSPPVFRFVGTALAALALLFGVLAAPAAHADRVDEIRKAGKLTCGLVTEPDDWNLVEHHGDVHEFAAEFCKAIGVVLLGDSANLSFHPYDSEADALRGLSKGEVEVVAGVSPSTAGQATLGLQYSPPIFYDAQAIMVSRSSKVATAADLSGKLVCVLEGREWEDTLASWLALKNIKVDFSSWSEQGEMDAALVSGRCAAESADISVLAFSRSQFHAMIKDFVFLPDTLSIDPLALAYQQGDARFGAIVDWTVNALIEAEAEGITRANAGTASDEGIPARKRLLGTDWATAQALALDKRWAVRAISAVGNYGEIYDRRLGPKSDFDIPRGLNALWKDGGLLTPTPLR